MERWIVPGKLSSHCDGFTSFSFIAYVFWHSSMVRGMWNSIYKNKITVEVVPAEDPGTLSLSSASSHLNILFCFIIL